MAKGNEPVDFNREIRPILSEYCYQCHGPDEQARQADLRLDRREMAVSGEQGYAAITPGNPEASLLVERINSTDPDVRMPPPQTKKRLKAKQKKLVARWIEQGAAYDEHWSFLPLSESPPPPVRNSAWAANPIDRFILAKLEENNLRPSSQADRFTLIKRLYIDLTGLLPSPEQTREAAARFERNGGAAIDALADQLLASPHYAERWARHWLDQARYADSHGYTIDGDRVMWPYRDWVIRAVGDDMPFDQFTIEQLAGDLLADPSKPQLVATGFHRNTLINQEGGTDEEQFRNEATVDRVNTTGAVWLGLTVGCAQCHSHKFDPISHREYYELFAFFNHGQDVNNTGPTVEVFENEFFCGATSVEVAEIKAADREISSLEKSKPVRRKQWEKKLLEKLEAKQSEDGKQSPKFDEALKTLPDKRTKEQSALLGKEFAKTDAPLTAAKKRLARARRALGWGPKAPSMIMRELKQPRETHIHLRGDFLRKDRQTGLLKPNVPHVLPDLADAPLATAGNSATRLDLARWLVRPDNPLTARVTVNRVWMRFFGKGLVETENDFGSQGASPTHPRLLDWLAQWFMENGWSMKRLHKLIVTSAVYRQSSHYRPDLIQRDGANRLLARQNRLRYPAEIVRDAALSASGMLTAKIGGPSVRPPQPDGIYAFTQTNKKWVADRGSQRYRRAMYTRFYRSAPYPMLTTFDAPDFQSVCTRRPRSNTPLQSLTMANDAALFELAKSLANRLMTANSSQTDAADRQRIEHAYFCCYCRAPNEEEIAAVTDFYWLQVQRFRADEKAAKAVAPKTAPKTFSISEAAAWTATARGLMNTDEFITRE